MTADYVAFHAAERPDAIAFIDNGRSITYAEFSRDIRKFVRELRDIGVSPGAWAGVGCGDLYLHWVLLLAFERLGIATASLKNQEGPHAWPLLEKLDIVLSEWDFPGAPVKRHHGITPQWIENVRRLPDASEETLPRNAGDDIVRILRTTGTTGEPKMLRSPRRTQSAWADVWIWSLGLTGRSRYLLMVALDVGPAYAWATAVIRAGGTVILETRMHVTEAISAHAITHTAIFPVHLRMILDTSPSRFVKPANLLIQTSGAPLSETLRERALARLATVVHNTYGANEVGLVSRITSSGSGGIATVLPFIEVAVVDDAGTPLPVGQVGRLRIKTPFMHSEYDGDPEATGRFFKDGWFQPEDLVILHGPRRLQVIGRSDEMLNIGGTKLPPNAVEEVVLRTINVKDSAVLSMQNREGIEEIWIAVVDAPLDDKELWARLERGLRPLQFAAFHVVRLPQIPRHPSGKIQRDLLRRAVANARAIRDSAQR